MRTPEVINFKDFMDNTWREKRKPKERKTFSMIPVPTFSTMFLNEPVLILAGISVVVIIGTVIEKSLVQKGKIEEAEAVSMLLGIGLPLAGFTGAVFVLFKACQAFL